jgi:hypothetical protein
LPFLDESRAPSDPGFAVGGNAVRDDEWGILRDRWHGTMREHDWPLAKEAKWHATQTGEVPPRLADALFAVVASSPAMRYVT